MTASQLLPWKDTDWAGLVAQHGSPLAVLDCQRVRQQYRALAEALPNVHLYYAIKALPHEAVIATLADEGAGFDIASNGEIHMLESLGVHPARTIHTHPIKRTHDIHTALRFGCTTFVVDNPDELEKFVSVRHRVALLIRVSFPNPLARVDLSRKFGCAVEELPTLLARADALGLHIKGLSFHVGSQVGSAKHHVHAIETLIPFFVQRRRQAVAPLTILDIGGGFPANYDGKAINIHDFCAPIRHVLRRLPANVRCIAEPGRIIAAPAIACVTRVIGRAKRGERMWYYLDDGVYNSFSGKIYDHTTYPIFALRTGEDAVECTLAGPTCDSIDVVAERIELPPLQIGDLLICPMMGAYTLASATDFNSLPRATVVVRNGVTERTPYLRVV